jgi:small conductance mechanosensitive channel
MTQPVLDAAALSDPMALFSPSALWARYGQAVIDGALNILAAAAILLIGLWLAGRVGKAVRRIAAKSPRIDDTLAGFLAQLVRYAILAFVILAVLQRFGVETTSIVAVIGATTLAIGLALQGTLSNVAAGVMLILFRPYRIGEFVEVASSTGKISDVGLFTTTLTTIDGVIVTLPNGLCWGAPIRNFSALPNRRFEIKVGVAYDTPLDLALDVVEDAVRADGRVLSTPEPFVKVTGLGDFAIDITAYAWAKNAEWFETRLDLLKGVKEALDAEGISIPFPTTLNYELRMDEAPKPPPPRAKRARPAHDIAEGHAK